MQQQTRQRTRRQRQSTPLPEKRERARQTTRRRHAHATHQHMVNTHRHSTAERRDEERRGKEEDKTTRGTRWCSGITCVLAELRAHYPEHQHKKKQKRRRTETKHHTTVAPRHSTTLNQHHYPTMTQSCHKDTALNQQCCDSTHKRVREENSETQFTHTTALPYPQRTHRNTAQKRKRGQHEGEQDNTRCRTQSEGGTSHYPIRPSTRP